MEWRMTIGLWEIVVPEATKNYVANPSYEIDGAGSYADYAASSGAGTRSQSVTWQKRGAYSCKMVKTTAGGVDADFGVTTTAADVSEFVSGSYATFSVDIDASAIGTGNNAYIQMIVTASTPYVVEKIIPLGSVGRYDITTGPIGATATKVQIWVFIRGDAAGTLYADGFQIERKSYATTYCDGTLPGCTWTGRAHYSASNRSAQERSGGRVYNLTDDLGLEIADPLGIGYAPIDHITQQSAQLPGATHIGEKINPRVITLASRISGSSLANLYSIRKDVIDVIKTDLVNNSQPFVLRYNGANSSKAAYITCYYDSGFEGSTQDGFVEPGIPLRLIAYDPFWYEDGNTAIALDVKDVVDTDYLLHYTGTEWITMDGGANLDVYALALGPDSRIYVGGTFTTVGGVTASRIAAWNQSSSAFETLGTGMNDDVRCMVFAPNGDLYAGGSFTTAGGVTCNGIAKWNTLNANPAWTALQQGGSGTAGIAHATNPYVKALALSPGGSLYLGGNFTTAGGVAAKNIAKWNTVTQEFSAMGVGIEDGYVSSIVIAPDGKIYIGGTFTNIGATNYDSIAYWDTATSDWLPVSTGVTGGNGYVFALAIDKNGDLIVGGDFTTAGGVSCSNIARWNGTRFLPMGDGLDDIVYGLTVTDEGIYALGKFDQTDAPEIGTGPSEQAAFWNGSNWVHVGFTPPAMDSPIVSPILIDGDKITMTPQAAGNAYVWGVTSVTNSGTRTAYPTIKVKRSGGTLAMIELIRNRTTGATLYLSYYLQDGEELTIDLTPGAKKCTSSYSGDVWSAILRNSDVGDFALQPGVNQIEAYVWDSGDPTITAVMEWTPKHWSVDGVAA
jgi:hypothetical protein